MLRLTQRTCRLGEKYAGQKAKEGEARTLKLTLEEIELDREEFNALCGQPHAWQVFYDTSTDVPKPYLDCFEYSYRGAWEGAYVALWYDMGKTKVEFAKAKITKIEVELRVGGDSYLTCTVEGEPALDRKFTEIIARVGCAIECEIRADRPDDQQKLPINAHDGAVPVTHKRKQGTH